MTQPAVSITESQVFTALRAVLLAMVPTGVPVVQGLTNRVPEVQAADFVLMTPMNRARLATNVDTYPDRSGATGAKLVATSTEVTMQLAVHGPNSANTAQVISSLFRDEFACEQFAATGFAIAPLFATDPRQAPYLNAEQQVEEQWIVDVSMQGNFTITLTQDFAAGLALGVISVEAAYHV